MEPSKPYKYIIHPPRGNQIAQLWNSWPWAFEAVALILSALQFMGIVGVLAYFNGRMAETSAIITPNTIVSVLSTGSKASLLSAAAGCISQSNWVLFADQPRRLLDFEMVADASRGPLGSIRLLFSQHFRGGLLVRLGALITLFTIALDPFAQQLVKLQNIQISRPGGQISQASRYSLGKAINLQAMFYWEADDDGHLRADRFIADADVAMKAAGMFGLAADTQSVMQQTTLDCPGEACKFSKVASLAICSRCNNITSLLERTEEEGPPLYSKITSDRSNNHKRDTLRTRPRTQYSLPNGLYLDNDDGSPHYFGLYMTTLGTVNRTKTLTMADIDTLIWSQNIIKVVNDTSATEEIPWPNYEVHASECALYYCAKEYNFTVHNSTKTETSSSEITDWKRNLESWQTDPWFKEKLELTPDVIDSVAYHPNNSFLPRTDLQLYVDVENGLARSWNLSKDAVTGISYFVQTLFSMCMSQNCSDAPDEWVAPTGYYYHNLQGYTEYEPAPSKILWEAKHINTTFANIARSMSNALQAGDDTKDSQIGTVIQSVTTYRIEWGWIALHCTTAVAMLSFFILTLLSRAPSGARVPVWKTSNLAILSRGPIVSDVLCDGQTLDQLERQAKLAQVSLLQVGPTDDMSAMDTKLQSSEQVEMTTFQNFQRANKSWHRPTPHYERL
ncbi:unnamed protein product [Clonostachys byssicola]|uniref:Uncharacterized protein n=1 Tax=Clonostachys byssicola TaxID=160290 RepID=A0A9N9UIT7_9HYPO|nr:unnamed protein product [Clonostachys byssicola]